MQQLNKSKKILIIILCVILSILLAAVSTFFVLTYVGKKQFHAKDTHTSMSEVTIEDDTTIVYNDQKYALNENIVSVLVLGIDRENINENLGSGNNGQADVIFVATIDTKTKKFCIIPISREIMADVNLYTPEGEYAGTKKEQLCLAYSYGTTAENCSKNVMTSVRRLFGGINISSYVAIEMEGVSQLTDMIGGIELTSLETINNKYINAVEGKKIKLNGIEALTYIQSRDDDIEANNRRMLRQQQFFSQLVTKTGNTVLNDFSNLTKYYTELSPYFSTNVSFAQITYLAQNCLTANLGDNIDYKKIDGTLTQGEKWVEFNPDEESLLQTVIDVFYVKK